MSPLYPPTVSCMNVAVGVCDDLEVTAVVVDLMMVVIMVMEMTMVMVEVKMINQPLMVSRRHCFVCGKTKRVVLAQLGGELLHWTPHCVIRRA